MSLLVLIGLLLLAGGNNVASAGQFSDEYFSAYEGAQVWRIDCVNEEECRGLRLWSSALQLDEWKFERPSKRSHGYLDVLVPSSQLTTCMSSMPLPVGVSVFVDNVAERMREQLAGCQGAHCSAEISAAAMKAGVNPEFFLSYHTYEEIVEFMQSFATTYPEYVTLFEFGQTVENRTILGLRIADDEVVDRQPTNQREILFNGLIHAREWISGATLTYLIDYLVNKIAFGPRDSDVHKFAWTVVPVLNADGYNFSWAENRLWRKNRRLNGLCYGVDNNRNFPYQWGITSGGESSSLPCAGTYHGPIPASEPETQALVNWWGKNAERAAAYFDIHAYGQYWLTPWGFTTVLPPARDYYRQNNCSTAAVKAIYDFDGRVYQNGEGGILYATSGDTVDTAYGTYKIVYSQTIELWGAASGNGFLLPPDQIIPQGREFVVGVLAAIDYILQTPP